NWDLAERCLARFEQRLRADVENVRRCVDADDRDELAQLAHCLKGSAATVSAPALTRTAAALESYARGPGTAEGDALVTDFLREVDRFLNAVPQLGQIG